MKILFISDIHGSLYFAERGIEAFYREKPDYMVLLGDLLYHGARNPLSKDYRPGEVADLLNEFSRRIIAVRGNCDSEVDQTVLAFPIMSTYTTIICGGRRLFLTHGHIYNENNMPNLDPGDVLVYGHTHINKITKSHGVFVINLASITLPKENNPHSYGVLEDDRFTIKDIDGSILERIDFIK